MKRLLIVLAIIVFVCNQTFATTFSKVCSTGQTLYYEITGTNTVRIVPPHAYTNSYYERNLYPSGMAPSGYLEIPSQVSSFSYGNFTVTEIGDYAFYCCDSLETVFVPSTVTSIGQYAFNRCDSLSVISIMNVTSIGACAFSYCRNLSSIWLPNGITEINESTFNSCSSLQFINIPTTVNIIKHYAFYGCSNLQSILIPSNVTQIMSTAFRDCTNLSSVTFSGNSRLTTLFPNVFRGCTSLHDICLPDSLSYVGGSSFENCTNLHKVTIGQSVTSIGPYTFRGCSNLDTIVVKPISAPSLGISAFDSTPDNKVIIVPCSSNYCVIWGTYGFNYTYNREYFLTLHSNNPARGYVSITQERGCDTSIIQAFAAENCLFLQWNDGDTTNPRTIITTSDASYTAFFEKQFNVVLVETNDSTMGTATGSGTYAAGNVVNLIAAPKSGYFFDSWNDGNTDNPRTIIPIDDTTITAIFSDIHDTVLIHDTMVVNIQIHDTTTLEVHDTTYINVSYAVHDTLYINNYDTIYINVPVHDTTYITVTDTMTVIQYDTVTNTVFDTIDNYVYDTVTVMDTLWLTLVDTIWLHDTIIIHDTIFVTQEGIDGFDIMKVKVYSNQEQIVIEGADGNMVTLYDVTGRVLATKQDDYSLLRFDTPASGTYMIKVGNLLSRKVVVVR